jgi:hypothetical protein
VTRSIHGTLYGTPLQASTSKLLKRLAAPQGFEPRYADPESAVLPLNEGAASKLDGNPENRASFDSMGYVIFGQPSGVAGVAEVAE